MNLRELLERRANLVGEARGILEAAEAEERELSQEEQNRWTELMDEVTKLSEQIQRLERQTAAESELRGSAGGGIRPEPGAGQGEQRTGRESAEYRAAFASFLRHGPGGLSTPEMRALQADSDTLGGYLVTPMQFVNELIKAVDNAVYMRQWATTYPVPTADSLGAPSLDTDPADPTWTSELQIGSEDSSMAFGRRELHPHPLAKYIKVSRKLLRMVPDVEALVIARLGYKFAVTAENAYLNGTGVGQPLGVFVASNDGISTSRDVSTGNTTTEIRFDGLIEAKFTLKSQYWPRARWLFHRDGVKQIAKLKDGDGQYIWSGSVAAGEPDRILGLPVFMSEYAPNTFTAGLYVGVLGDWSFYWIADALDLEVQRLVELYAATNQVGFIGRLESDGMPVLAEAFVRVKLAT